MLLWLDDVYGYCLKQFTPNINTNKTAFFSYPPDALQIENLGEIEKYYYAYCINDPERV